MDILAALKAEESKFVQHLETIRGAIKLFKRDLANSGKFGRKRRGTSAVTRAKMARAAKKRWGKIKAAKKDG